MANIFERSKSWAAVLGLAAIAVLPGCNSDNGSSTPATEAAKPAAPGAAPATAANAPPAQTADAAAQRTDLTIGDLLRNAGTAVSERRLVDPPGNNAVDFYLLALGRDPNNRAAQDGLREIFPLATGEVEQMINAGKVDDARGAVDRLAKFDSNNYTLTILRSKLDLKKKQMDRDEERQRDQDKEKALAAANQAKPNAPAAAAAPAPAEAKPETAAAASKPAAAPAPAPVAAAPAAAPSGETRAAVAVSQPSPAYPPSAARTRASGWVEVAFTVAADGSVKDGSVVNAVPARTFNAAALEAISKWKFQPRLVNGQATEQQMHTRIEFKMPGS